MSNASARIELLTKSNFDTWSIQIEALLSKSDLWEYVNGEIPKPKDLPDDSNKNAIRTWSNADKKAKSDIILSMNPSELKSIKGCETSRDIWRKLESIHASKGPARKATLLKKLIVCKLKEGDDIGHYLDEFFDIVDKLAAMEIEINDDLLCILMLQGLPMSYDNFRCAIESRDALPTPEELKIKIQNESIVRCNDSQNGAGDALMTRSKVRKNEKEKKKTIKCFKCHRLGHFARDCKVKLPLRDNAGTVQDFYVYEEMIEEVNQARRDPKTRWCLDSGCTTHMCNDGKKLQGKVQCDIVLKMANEASTTAKMNGVASISVSGDECKSVNLHNTLHVPGLRTNLVSVAKVTDKGAEVVFRKKEALVIDSQGNTIMTADRIGDLYFVREDMEEFAQRAGHPQCSDIQLWHKRLSHVHMKAVRDLFNKGLATGITLTATGGTSNCEVCRRGKLTAKPFKERVGRSKEKLKIIHSDVCGPMRVHSNGGARYFVTFSDDSTTWCVVYFIKSKSEVFGKFREYKNMVEVYTGAKIKFLQSDNGREYCNGDFDKYLMHEGIQRRLSVPHTPEQNGVAERRNRTLLDAAKCMLIESGLPQSYWAEAVATANYVRNRCPSRCIGGKTPYELWHGRVPDLSHMRIFGAKAFVLDKSPGKGKFDARSMEGRLMGYSEQAKAYRVRLNNSKMVLSRDVEFDEHVGLPEYNVEPLKIRESIPTLNPENLARGQKEGANRGDSNLSPGWTEIETTPIITESTSQTPKRGRGRPKIVRDGRRGRPKKQYRMVNVTRQGTISTEGDEDDSDDVLYEDGDKVLENDNDDDNKNTCRVVVEETFNADILVRDALSGKDAVEWKRAIVAEMKSHLEHGTWEMVPRPANKNVISSKIILKNKLKPDGSIERRKARVVARGFTQRPGFDYIDTFAPVARLESVRLMMALAVDRGVKVQQLDVTTAYLNGELTEELYMEAPEMLSEAIDEIIRTKGEDPKILKAAIKIQESMKHGNQVCRLSKAIYGLKQSGKVWYEKLAKIFKHLGLKPTVSDPCVFQAKRGDKITIICVYVDDMLLISDDEEHLQFVKKGLSRELKIKDLGEAEQCLGIEICQEDGIKLSQQRYIGTVLERFGMTECNSNVTPASTDSKFQTTRDEIGDGNADKRPYRELVGSLMYLAVATRPDIAFTVSRLAQFNENPSDQHWGAAKRVLRYLNGTSGYCLRYTKPVGRLVGYVDADWAACSMDRRSYSGYVYLLAGAAVSWRAQKQKTVALSSTESEYMALAEAVKESIFLNKFLKELGFDDKVNRTIFCDNQGAKMLAGNPMFHPRTKHIDIKYHFVRDAVRKELIQVKHISTDEMVADIFTKVLPRKKHYMCTSRLGLETVRCQ